jgi:mRNA-degrading endonuclease RelE of RelBE toxin-antitoxin system
MPQKKKFKKLTPRERALASRFIPEEYESPRFKHAKRSQKIAVGISRARRRAEQERVDAIVNKYLPRG